MRDFGKQIWLNALYPVCRVVSNCSICIAGLQRFTLGKAILYALLVLKESCDLCALPILSSWTQSTDLKQPHHWSIESPKRYTETSGCCFQTRPECKTAQFISYAEDNFYAFCWHCDIWVSDRLSEFRLRAGVYYNLEICPPSPERWNFYLDMSRSDGTNNTTSIKSRAAQSRHNQPGSQHRRVTRCRLASATAIT